MANVVFDLTDRTVAVTGCARCVDRTHMINSVPAERPARLTVDILMGRFADASEMAAAVAFLASDDAAYTAVVQPVESRLSM